LGHLIALLEKLDDRDTPDWKAAEDGWSNSLDRDFTAQAPNRVWVTDSAYVRMWAGWVYVAFILDVYAQRIIAWHAATCMDVELAMRPLRMAICGLIRHSTPANEPSPRWLFPVFLMLSLCFSTATQTQSSSYPVGSPKPSQTTHHFVLFLILWTPVRPKPHRSD
jgi:hypothetical protein